MCDCIEKVNEETVDKGGYIDTVCLSSMRDPKAPIREVVRIKLLPTTNAPKVRPKFVIPIFCPFCGERYPSKDSSHE